jgi:hypothetical protein
MAENYTFRRSYFFEKCLFLCCTIFIFGFHLCLAQEEDANQKTIMGVQAADTLKSDTTKVVEVAALDIAQNRGLFIVTPDKKM